MLRHIIKIITFKEKIDLGYYSWYEDVTFPTEFLKELKYVTMKKNMIEGVSDIRIQFLNA